MPRSLASNRSAIQSPNLNLTVSGNEITDATRTAALSWGTSQSGGQTDGQTVPAGYGIWGGVTNFFPRGQCDSVNDTAWNNTDAGMTVSIDATTPAPFSPQSVKFTTDGSQANQSGRAQTNTGRAAAAGNIANGSIYVKGVAGQSYNCRLIWSNTDATTTQGADTTFTATGSWQVIRPTSLAVAVGKTGDQVRLRSFINGTRAETFWLAHAMITITGATANQSFVHTPYIATSGGNSATSSNARVTAPSSLLTAPQFWWAMRVQVGWDATEVTSNSFPTFVNWQTDNNNRICILFNGANLRVAMDMRTTATGAVDANSAVQSFSRGDYLTLIGYVTPTSHGISVNGVNFVTSSVTTANQTPSGTTFDIGSNVTAGCDSNVLWFASGIGTLTNADASTLNGFGNTAPTFFQLQQLNSGFASPSLLWNALTVASTRVPRFGFIQARITASARNPVV